MGEQLAKVGGGVSVNVTVSGADIWGPNRLAKAVQAAVYQAVTDDDTSERHAVTVNVSIEVE